MHFAVVGAGAVGGYYAALLARAGHTVSVVARGAHLEAVRRDGLRVESTAVGDFVVPVRAESDPAAIGPADAVLFAVKTYSNPEALKIVPPLMGPETVVLTLQNGVESAGEVAAVAGEDRTIAGATYIATAIDRPGVVRQTGAHRRIVFGEWFGLRGEVTSRVHAIETAMRGADIHAEAVADARVPIWEKFVYLAPFAAVTGAARLPIGPIWNDPDGRGVFLQAVAEVERVARASGVSIAPDMQARIEAYVEGIPPSTRSSLLIDLEAGKPIEVESLLGSAVRRGRAAGLVLPVMSALYAVLKPHVAGAAEGGS